MTRLNRWQIAGIFIGALLLGACQALLPERIATPTAPNAATPTLANTATATLAPAVSPSPSVLPLLESPMPSETAGPPTETPLPTETPGPVEYQIQAGDTLLYIIQQPPFFYRDTNVINEILRLNPNILSIDRLPPPGSSILIPLPTPTLTPEGYELTRTAQPPITQVVSALEAPLEEVEVREGQTILGVAAENRTTINIIATLNPEIQFFGCDFSNPSGGPDCNVPLVIGQRIRVPAPTPTPTLSPTVSGSETPTATPTYPAPRAFFPPQDGTVSAAAFQVQWLSVGELAENEFYFLEVQDTVTQQLFTAVTKNTSYRLPPELIPSDGQAHLMRWRVSVVIPNASGTAYQRITQPEPEWRSFTWLSR